MPELPEEFIKRIQKRRGEDFPAFLRALELPQRKKGLHVNTLKISSEEFRKISLFPLKEPVPWAKDCFYHDEEKAGGDLFHFAGLFYLQEPSAACAAPLLDVRPGERVLDLCAAPGGKTAQLASALGGKGLLVSNEIDGRRAEILSQNVERLGISNCAVTCAPPEKLSERFPAYFDKILVDAPCSGEGMFRKEPNAVKEWSPENVRRCALRQREILEHAAKMLAGGGRLVYSTCTFAEEEDEWQIEEFLKSHPEFELLSMEKLLPHEIEGEGHFAAALYKKEGARARGREAVPERCAAAERAFYDFGGRCLETLPEGAIATLKDGRMYLLPGGAPDLRGIRLLRLGTELGEWDGNRFKPAHALALSSAVRAKRRFETERETAERYLRGETLEAPPGAEDYAAICFEGYPLGWAKAVRGMFKNHLPKALRKYAKN